MIYFWGQTSSWSTQESNQVGDVSDMCGILALFGADPQANSELRAELLRWWRLLRVGSSYLQNMFLSELSVTQPLIIFSLSKLLRHRGPDWNGITCFRNCYLAHERLAINGLLSGAQVYNLSSKLSLRFNWMVMEVSIISLSAADHEHQRGHGAVCQWRDLQPCCEC